MEFSACYCALCSGPLSIYYIRVGSSKAKHLARRRRRVENQRRKLGGEDVVSLSSEYEEEAESETEEAEEGEEETNSHDGDQEMNDAHASGHEGGSEENHDVTDGDEDMADDSSNTEHARPSHTGPCDSGFFENLSQASEVPVSSEFDMTEDAQDDTYSVFGYTETKTYDPNKIDLADVEWTNRSRVLALNKSLEDGKQAFLSGRGRFANYFRYHIWHSGGDPRDTGADTHLVYHAYDPTQQVPAFPIHEACFKILTKCFVAKAREKINKDVLYAVMLQKTEDLAHHLELDYGPIKGADQFWECIPGEEWSAMDPGEKPGIGQVLMSMLPPRPFPATPPLNLEHKVRHDPFAMLPYDLLHEIIVQLSLQDTLSLTKASWHVFKSTHNPAFWRLMMRLHLGFFWELNGFFQDKTFPHAFDWRGMLEWLDKITKGTVGMEGPIMAIANRRRIWNVCEQLAPLYFEKLHAEVYTEPDESKAAAIMTSAGYSTVLE